MGIIKTILLASILVSTDSLIPARGQQPLTVWGKTGGDKTDQGRPAGNLPGNRDRLEEIRAWPLYEPCVPVVTDKPAMAAALGQLGAPDAAKRLEAIGRLTGMCAPEMVDPLLVALRDDDVKVRIAAIETLGRLGDQRSIEQLVALAFDPDWRIRAVLGRTLASFQVYQPSNTVLNGIVNPGGRPIVDAGDLRARCLGVLMVNQLHDVRFSRKSIGFLFTFLDLPDAELRSIAEETAAELKKTRNGYHELVGIARKPGYPGYRIRAIEWLARWNMKEGREVIAEISATDTNPRVSEAATKALATLGKPDPK